MKLSTRHHHIWIIIVVLLFIVAARLLALPQMPMNTDEIWSVWQTMGTPQQIIQWTPFDWPPLYYLVLGGWRAVAGMDPFVLRYLSLLSFLIGCAALYRILRRLGERQAAFLVVPAYAAIGYIGVLGTEVRGYALLLGLLPVTFWLTLRYFDHPRWGRGIVLGICFAAMFYISLSSVGAFFILGFYSLIVYRRKVYLWWLPGIIAAGLALPEIQDKLRLMVVRTAATLNLNLPPLPQALVTLYQAFLANQSILIWSILLAVASLLILYRWRKISRLNIALLTWGLGGTLLLYFTNPILGFFTPRYAWWVMIGIALWTAYGLARLPRPLFVLAEAIFIILAFSAVPIPQVDDFFPPIGPNLVWLKVHMQSGDVVVLDKSSNCGPPESWDYYLHLYFPQGLQFTSDVTGYRRIWYVTFDGRQDSALYKQVSENRIPSEYVGPAACLVRLYEAPPDIQGIAFENGMRFHGVDVIDSSGLIWSGPIVRREGETVHLRLWWSIDHPVSLDFSVGAYIMGTPDGFIAQSDSAPHVIYPSGAPQETSQWQPGQYYIEERDLKLPYPMVKTSTQIEMAVYFWQDERRITAPGINENGFLPLRQLNIMAW